MNTALADPYLLNQKLRDYYNKIANSQHSSDDEISSDSTSSSDSDSDSSDVRIVNDE